MATASRNFDFTTSDLEGTTERGFSALISTLLDPGSPSLEMTEASSGTNQVEGRFGGAADTWETLFGIPAGSTVTSVQFTAWTTARWGSTGITALTFSGYIRNALDDVDVCAGAGGSGFSSNIIGDVAGSFTAPKGPGTDRAVDASYRSSNTLVGIEVDIATVGTGTFDAGIKNVNVTITYTAATHNTWKQWTDAFDANTTETSCTLVADSPDIYAKAVATISSGSDTADRATGDVTNSTKLPTSEKGHYRGHIILPASYAPTASHILVAAYNSTPTAIFELYLDSKKNVNVFSGVNILHSAGINNPTSWNLRDGIRYAFDVEYIKNNYLKVWLDRRLIINVSCSGATLSAIATLFCVGIHHYDGAGGDPGFTFTHQFAQFSEDVGTLLSDPVPPAIEPDMKNFPKALLR